MTETETGTVRKTKHFLSALRHELIANASVKRPLPPLPRNGPGMTLLPGRYSDALRRLPHIAVCVFAGVLFWLSWSMYGDSSGAYDETSSQRGILLGLAAAVPLVLVLSRPVAAWWLSLAGICVVAASGLDTELWPFAETTSASHLTVMVLVALRSQPRVAVVMWLCTAAAGNVVVKVFHQEAWEVNNVADFTLWSAIALTCAALVRGWWDARGRAVASHTETLAERSRRTTLEERTTIARELHDVVAHHMSLIAIQAEAAPYRVEKPPPELAASFVTIRENAVAALAELRRVLGVIRISDYGHDDDPEAPQPTLDALDGLLDNVRKAGLPVEKVVVGARRDLPQGVELSAYRIVQEALSNALRHAPGADTRVELAYVLGGLAVRVVNGPVGADAGPGTEAGSLNLGSGQGITGMRERVVMLHGELTAGPAAEGGYEVVAWLPTPAEAAQPTVMETV